MGSAKVKVWEYIQEHCCFYANLLHRCKRLLDNSLPRHLAPRQLATSSRKFILKLRQLALSRDNSPQLKKKIYTYLIYKYCYYSLIFENHNKKSSIQFLNFIIKKIVNKICFEINIIDIYTNETIANKSSLKHYHH